MIVNGSLKRTMGIKTQLSYKLSFLFVILFHTDANTCASFVTPLSEMDNSVSEQVI